MMDVGLYIMYHTRANVALDHSSIRTLYIQVCLDKLYYTVNSPI